MDAAMSHHRSGRLAAAESIYRQILAQHPNHAGALHLLAAIAHQVGRHDAAVDLFKRSISIEPGTAILYTNFTLALLALGRFDEAVAAASRATQLQPDSASTWFFLGHALHDQGKLDESIAAYQRAIGLKPDYADAYNNLGNVWKERGRFDEAVAALSKAVELKPFFPEAYSNLGDALACRGNLAEAFAACSKAVQQQPNLPEAHYNLARVLRNQQKADDAATACSWAVQLKPDYAQAVNLLGAILMEQDKFDQAAAAFSKAIELKPQSPDAHNNMGNIWREQGQIDQALACHDRAMALNPQDPVYHSNRLYTLHFHPACDPAAIAAEHRTWNSRHAEPLKKFVQHHCNTSDPDRRLKIGYVSPDLWAHPVGRFLLPLLENHDRAMFEVSCYADGHVADEMTRRLRRHCDGWCSIAGLTDEQVADRVRGDRIDILVDLAGHTSKNRLLVFARKPGPVQVTWLGYPDTTGMTAMDYRITDSHADPPGMTEQFHTEHLERLPDSFLCYRPAEEPIAVAPPPSLARGHVTFGSFNTGAKINPLVVGLWARILQCLGYARLMIKYHALSSSGARQHLLSLFAAHGIDSNRLDMRNTMMSPLEHMRMYEHVDIALDTFPYHGTTTTCEALWMGVPVISLAGQTHVSRVGVSILSSAGLGELLAKNAEEYVGLAVKLAADPRRLSELRAGLRDRMRSSVLMDAPRFARNIEAAFRKMWSNWLQ